MVVHDNVMAKTIVAEEGSSATRKNYNQTENFGKNADNFL